MKMDIFNYLKKQIGDKLFNQLSYSDKLFMAETAGSIDFGHAVDLYQIAREMRNDRTINIST